MSEAITGSRLPSKKQVLCNLFYYQRVKKLSVRDSAKLVAQHVISLWKKTKVPCIQEIHVIDEIVKCHAEWRKVTKNVKKRSSAQTGKEEEYKKSLDGLFDIAKQSAFDAMATSRDRAVLEDRLFLISQREKRQGYISVDYEDVAVQTRKVSKEHSANRRKLQAAEMQGKLGKLSYSKSLF